MPLSSAPAWKARPLAGTLLTAGARAGHQASRSFDFCLWKCRRACSHTRTRAHTRMGTHTLSPAALRHPSPGRPAPSWHRPTPDPVSPCLSVLQSQAEGVPAPAVRVLQPDLRQHHHPRELPATPGEPMNISEIVLWRSVHKSCTQTPKGASSTPPTESLTFRPSPPICGCRCVRCEAGVWLPDSHGISTFSCFIHVEGD